MSTRSQVLQFLSDGYFHSGTEMGQSLGMSRAAINKAIKSLTDMGLVIHRVTGKGYRMIDATPLLAAAEIRKFVTSPAIAGLHVLDEVDSTSRYLLRLASETSVAGHVCLAEMQKQGRGRRGREWLATPYSNIMLSMAWQYATGPGALAGLSLAAGVAIVEALNDLGVQEIGLKWPNDILFQNKKLGGVLVDIQGEASGPTLVVLGVGINIKLQSQHAKEIDQQWTDLHQLGGNLPDRNRLAARLADNLAHMFETFSEKGFAYYQARWQQLHVYHNQPVRLLLAETEVHGTAQGVDASGALRIRDAGGSERVFHSGEVSLRPA